MMREAGPRCVAKFAISATLLSGLYVEGDPYAAYREEEPLAVLAGGSLFVFAPR